MENTEQIVPNGNIVMNSINDYRVDDADDFYYNPENEKPLINDYTSLNSVESQAFRNFENDSEDEGNVNNGVSNDFSNQNDLSSTVEPLDFNQFASVTSNGLQEKEEANANVLGNISNDLSSDQIDNMIKEEETKTTFDDSYVLSNFDVLFDSLYNDVNGANNFISDLIAQKKSVNVNEANLTEMQNKLEKEKEEFAKFVDAQKQSIELEKAQCNEYVKNQRIRLQNEEEQFNNDCEATRAELKLEEEKIKIANEKLENEKNQFARTREIEEEKIRTDRTKLKTEQEQFEKEKEIALERIKQGQKELQSQKEQFAKTKELEEKKLELESKNLSQSCARFKELVSQFNSGFQQLPGDRG